MKKALAFVAALAMLFCFTACGSSDQADVEETTVAEAVSGGWEVVADPAEADLPDDVEAAFENFEENYGDDLIPMAYYGSQVVEGMNYGLLCKSKSDNELQTAVLWKEPNGNVSDAIINTFNIADYTEGDGADVSGEPAAGSWEVPEDYTKAEIPEEAQNAFDKAVGQMDGNELTPMAYLGSQLVAGTNYAILCHSTLVTAEPVTSIQVVIVYEDLEGNCEITNINTLDLASFTE